jgi:FAD/FMN-containing dehydrogenase
MGLEGLTEAMSSGSVDTRPEILESCGASGSASGAMPRAAVFPESVEDVASLERWAASSGLIMPVSSAGPHRSAVVTSESYVVADLSRMKKIVRADRRNRGALIEAGVTFSELQRALERVGPRS